MCNQESLKRKYKTEGEFAWVLYVKLVSSYTVMRNYGMNQNFADINPERDFQLFNDEKNSHL